MTHKTLEDKGFCGVFATAPRTIDALNGTRYTQEPKNIIHVLPNCKCSPLLLLHLYPRACLAMQDPNPHLGTSEITGIELEAK